MYTYEGDIDMQFVKLSLFNRFKLIFYILTGQRCNLSRVTITLPDPK